MIARKKAIYLLAFLIIFSFPSQASADVLNFETPYVEVNDNIQIFEEKKHDVLLIGEIISINQPIDGDLYIFGTNVKIDSPVYGNVRVLATSIEVSSYIQGSLTFLADKVYITSTGDIDKDAYGVASRFIHDGRIGRNLNLKFSPQTQITISGKVIGNFTYSDARPNISENAFIQGKTEKQEFIPPINEKQKRLEILLSKLFHTMSLSLVGIVILKLRGDKFNLIYKKFESQILKNNIYGLLGIIAISALSFFLFVTVIGIPLGLILIFLTVLTIYLSPLLPAVWIGKKLFKSDTIRPIHILTGLLIYDVISLAPLLGTFMAFVFAILAVGVFVRQILNR